MRPENKIIRRDDLPDVRMRHKEIALCSGCFDILQPGHAVFFQQCKDAAETLVVVVGRDASIARQKPSRPLNPENNRLYLVAALADVDYTILGEEEMKPGKIDYYHVAEDLRPDVLILNDDDSGLVEKRAFCERLGIRLVTVQRVVPDFLTPTSTSEIIAKAKTVP